jgi:uncharacterized protein
MEENNCGKLSFSGEASGILIDELRRIFRDVDEKVEEFKALTGVRCPDMCGICCASEKVETTVVEMMPLAEELWKTGRADHFLEKIQEFEDRGPCVFFEKDKITPGNGRCGVYALRPLICRLFGFFTVKDKTGKYVYGSCKVMKEKYPENYKKAVELVERGDHLSNVTDHTIKIISMGTGISKKMYPINLAAKMAIEKTGFDQTTRRFA